MRGANVTSYEHVMLGVTGTLAAGLHRRHGWPIVAVAGAAAILPDWDGLSLAFGAAAFDQVHRAWGHNLFAAIVAGSLVAVLEYRFGWLERAGVRLCRKLKLPQPDSDPTGPRQLRSSNLAIWIVVGVAASLSHLGADVLFSGHATLPDWGIRLFWPFCDRALAYPMVPWGDPGVSLIFAAGMFGMVRWPTRLQCVAGATLAAGTVYVLIRGWAPQLWM
jgi:membrane-bound metal-dependent hydrolase YbcI (DUF457 family)